MKLLSAQFSVVVEYHGILLAVPEGTKYIATDEDGAAYAYRDCGGEPMHTNDFEWYSNHDDTTFVGEVDREGMNWKDTLMTLNTEGE